LLSNPRIADRFVDHLTASLARHRVGLLSWVIMPEHVHLVIFPHEPEAVPTFLSGLKRPFAYEVLSRWRALDASILKRLVCGDGHRFWQTGGGYDRVVIGDELLEKVRYCHLNPLRRGLAAHSADWRWSSARWYAGRPDAAGPPIAAELLPATPQDLI
jgi:putative transposase